MSFQKVYPLDMFAQSSSIIKKDEKSSIMDTTASPPKVKEDNEEKKEGQSFWSRFKINRNVKNSE